jgi:hypothetical protein
MPGISLPRPRDVRPLRKARAPPFVVLGDRMELRQVERYDLNGCLCAHATCKHARLTTRRSTSTEVTPLRSRIICRAVAEVARHTRIGQSVARPMPAGCHVPTCGRRTWECESGGVTPATRTPIFFGIDVEPDQQFDVGPQGPASWSGVATIRRRLEDVRQQLEDVTESAFLVGWYLRMDPQIEAICGTADHAARLFGDDLRQLAQNDRAYLGLHVHATRWDEAETAWVLDTRNPDVWLEHLRVGLDAYTASMGAPPLRHRFTIDVTSAPMVAALRQAGVRVDLKAAGTPASGYFDRLPCEPYLARSGSRSEGPWVIPASSISLPLRYGGPAWRKNARRVRRGPFNRVRLNPYGLSLTPAEYWDLVGLSITELPRPYISIAFRTWLEDSWQDARQRALLNALVDHPLARTVRFADPLEIVPRG